jgi:pyruvate,water dikinase
MVAVMENKKNRFCLPLDQAHSVELAGGKAVNLSRVSSLGLPIPNSFVITTSAVEYFLKEMGLHELVALFLTQLADQDGDQQSTAYKRLCHEVMIADIPKILRAETTSFAESLLTDAPHGLAVRSSACFEDSEHTSFAGIFDSFLCVRTHEDLWDRIKKCWCSCWNAQAVAYANRRRITIDTDSMAVLVQETLYPDRSGVIFTADPSTGNPWHFSINATFGFLQAAIDGQAAADHYLLEWDTGKILEQNVVKKETCQMPGDSELVTERTDPVQAGQPSLDERALNKLWPAATKIDRVFAKRMDIEWVLQSDKLTIIQARPVTALPQFFPHSLSKEEAKLTWYLSNPFWYLPAEVGGQLVAPICRHIWDAEMWRRAVPGGLELLSRACREKDFNGYRYTTEGWSGVSGDWLDILAANGEEHELQRIFESTERRLDEIEEELRKIWKDGKQRFLNLTRIAREEIRRTETARELIPHLLKEFEYDPRGNYMGYGAPQSLGMICERMLKWYLHRWLPEFPVENLLMGLSSYSHEKLAAAQRIGREVWEEPVRKALETKPVDQVIQFLLDQNAGRAFIQEIEEFCWSFGQFPPSWRDRPSMWTTGTAAWADFSGEIMIIIKKAMQGKGRDIRQLENSNKKLRQEAIDQARRQLSPSLHLRFNKLLNWTEFWFPILDDRIWVGGRWNLARYELLWHIAMRLTEEGLIDSPDEVFLLSREDLELFLMDPGFDLRRVYLSNKAEYEKNKRLIPPPYLGKTPPESAAQAAVEPVVELADGAPVAVLKELVGIGRTVGKIQGHAKVASGLSAAFLDKLTDQDILVCLEEIPFRVDWLAIFLVAKGLVAADNCGAGLHHAIQIARECGVVYVELSKESVRQIADNALIELDGRAGLVTIL